MVFGCVAVAMRPVVRVKGCCVGGGRAAGVGRAAPPFGKLVPPFSSVCGSFIV